MDLRMSVTPPSMQFHLEPECRLPDHYASRVMEACELLSEAGSRFEVSGFGRCHWPVDVPYDLSIVIEQLPAAITDFQHGRVATIDFSGQGVETCLTFTPVNGMARIQCSSRTEWRPAPDTEQVSARAVLDLFEGLVREFKVALNATSPTLTAMLPFKNW